MLSNSPARRRALPEQGKLDRWVRLRAAILGVLLVATISAMLIIDFLPSNRVILNVGDVASEAIFAPHDLSYESEILTEQAREANAASVQEIYDPPDASIARQQEVRARQILDYISSVRQDSYATLDQKTRWIAAIPDLNLSQSAIERMLNLTEAQWLEVRDETVRVLVRAMQGVDIKESAVANVRRLLPTLISLGMTGDQAAVVEAISGSLVTANTFYNAARTEEARQEARASVEPVKVTIRA